MTLEEERRKWKVIMKGERERDHGIKMGNIEIEEKDRG